jgi:NAD(P)-dependent dehydrogenase (short-subunit alcohol dehydrogenase family)
VSTIVTKHARLDGLVKNAGICPLEAPLPDNSLFDDIIDINLKGTWNSGLPALHQMKTQSWGASIVNIGSTSSLVGVARLPGYTASKHAVLSLTRAWAQVFVGNNIRVNCVAPGGVQVLQSYTEPLLTASSYLRHRHTNGQEPTADVDRPQVWRRQDR